MANAFIDIKEDAAPTKKLASQSFVRGVDTVHQEEVTLGDGTTNGTILGVAATPLRVDTTGTTAQPVTDNAGSLTVDALDLDIRNLVPAQDEVKVSGTAGDGIAVAGNPVRIAGKDAGGLTQDIATDAAGELQVDVLSSILPVGASTSALQLPNSHDVTVDNAAGAAAINVQDGGNTLTIDAPVGVPVAIRQSDGAAFIEVRGGEIAHNVADSGNPVKIGSKGYGALPAAVTADARVNAYFDREGRQIVRPWGGGDWAQVHLPVANTRATSTKAAGAAGIRHVCTGITVVLAGDATAPVAIALDVRLRDGIADVGTILWQSKITLPAVAGAMNGITRTGLFIRGAAATAMTLEFSAAGGANTFESVSIEGVDITEA